ncbi:MAG: pyridoxal-phosphate dependent enzyme [Rhizobiaceae bacterium]|nr:MAG: pyridoxal-phosphate dependent enzyme [Rhizobiaceae bacterium]
MTGTMRYSCLRCGVSYPTETAIDSRGCPTCADTAPANLMVVNDGRATARAIPGDTLPSLWRYAGALPCPAESAVSLGEGLTPLISAPAIGAQLGVQHLFVKNEGCNPTWSHKDRFSTVAVSFAKASGAHVVATASSGNAGASLAAYAAYAGLSCVVATFSEAAGPMLAQIRKYGATLVPFAHKEDRWKFIAEGAERFGWFVTSPCHAPVVGSHPVGIAGYKTLAYEIVEQLGGSAPDWCALPVCYGDALIGLWQGFEDLFRGGEIANLPRLIATEVHGSLAAALAGQSDRIPDMTARFRPLAGSIGATRGTYQALKALRQSRGVAVPVGNDGLIELQEAFARKEGVLAELSSVTPLAAIADLRRRNVIGAFDRVVAIVTGSGLKDFDRSTAPDREEPLFRSVSDAWNYLRDEAPGAAFEAVA